MEMTNRWSLPQQKLSKTPAVVEFALLVIAVLTQTRVAISTILHRYYAANHQFGGVDGIQ